MKNIPSSILTMLAGILLTLVSLWYGQNHGLLPIPASKEAELVDGLFNTMMTISIGLVLFVEGVLVITAVRFYRRKGDMEDGPHLEGNVPLEILWTAIPAVIVMGISVYSFEVYTEMGGLNLMGASMAHHHSQPVKVAYAPTADVSLPILASTDKTQRSAVNLATNGLGPSPDLAESGSGLMVKVTALQFAFLFNYPDSGITSGELHVPANREVRLFMSAQDVIHAFWVPELRLKQDVIPGQETELTFIANRIGTYPIICAELCGPYHGGMKAQLFVDAPEDYETWVQSQVAQQDDGMTAVATVPASERSDADYLTPFVEPLNLEVEAAALADLHQQALDHTQLATHLMP